MVAENWSDLADRNKEGIGGIGWVRYIDPIDFLVNPTLDKGCENPKGASKQRKIVARICFEGWAGCWGDDGAVIHGAYRCERCLLDTKLFKAGEKGIACCLVDRAYPTVKSVAEKDAS